MTTSDIQRQLRKEERPYRDYEVMAYLVKTGKPLRTILNEYGFDRDDYINQLHEHGLADSTIDYDYICTELKQKTRSVRVDHTQERAYTDGGDWLDPRTKKAATGNKHHQELDGWIQEYTSAEDAKSATQIHARDAPEEKRPFYTRLSELNDGRGEGASNHAGEKAAGTVVNSDERYRRRTAEALCDSLGLSRRQKVQVLSIVVREDFRRYNYLGGLPEPFFGIIAFVLYEDVDRALQDERFFGHEYTVEQMFKKLTERRYVAGYY